MHSPCIISPVATNNSGYASGRIGGRVAGLHRIAYVTARGVSLESIKGSLVRHLCDVRTCVNPAHLELGTPHDNNQDMVKRDRSCSTLTQTQVVELRMRYIRGTSRHNPGNRAALCLEYGVTQSSFSKYITGTSHAHTYKS